MSKIDDAKKRLKAVPKRPDRSVIAAIKEIGRVMSGTAIVVTYDTGLEWADDVIHVRSHNTKGKKFVYWETKLSRDKEWSNVMYRTAQEAIVSHMEV